METLSCFDSDDTMPADVGSTLGTLTSAADSSEDEALLSTAEKRCACQCGFALAALKAQVKQQGDIISLLISCIEALEQRRQPQENDQPTPTVRRGVPRDDITVEEIYNKMIIPRDADGNIAECEFKKEVRDMYLKEVHKRRPAHRCTFDSSDIYQGV